MDQNFPLQTQRKVVPPSRIFLPPWNNPYVHCIKDIAVSGPFCFEVEVII